MTIQQQIWLACLWEAQSRKLGNVHPGASFTDLSFTDFAISAGAAASSLGNPKSSFGKSIYEAVLVNQLIVGKNTNLGICLLLEPLIRAARPRDVGQVLAATTVDDAVRVYAAIRKAQPGGLGVRCEQDISTDPTVTLLEAMKLAADDDLIARQYATAYRDVFDLGVPALVEGFKQFGCVEAAVIHCQLSFMAHLPDTLIARKCDRETAEQVRDRVRAVESLGGIAEPAGRSAAKSLDSHLRSDGNRLNPGATADLIAAALFIALREGRISVKSPFPWSVEDWL